MERRRRALAQVGGRVTTEGDPEVSAALARAWRQATKADPDTLTHGFHSWPARMHHGLARTVLQAFDGETVLDPFSGGGTVLVEALVAGRRGIGVDLDPLAPLLGHVKTMVRSRDERIRFAKTAESVAAASEDRVMARVPIRVDLPEEEIRWYGPHVLKELGGLLEEIRAVTDRADRRALAMVFSAIVVKVSKQRADTAEAEAPRRVRKGLATEIFLRKAHELTKRWAQLEAVAKGPAPVFHRGDARDLAELLGPEKVDLVLTSPPYGGTYDYASHHARRAAWLKLPGDDMRRGEIGARRRLNRAGGERAWDREVSAMLGSMAAVLKPGGHAVLVMGDADVGDRRVEVLPQLARLGPAKGLTPVAAASQPRRDWRGNRPREEHLVALRRG